MDRRRCNVQKLGVILSLIFSLSSLHAKDNRVGYDFIKECKNINEDNKVISLPTWGYIYGLSAAYIEVIKNKKIDNIYGSYSVKEYASKMCDLTLKFRNKTNKETKGKYEVGNFIYDLQYMGYYLTLSEYEQDDNDENTTK